LTSLEAQPTGLRERKKARTRAAIQAHAMRLFSRQGYDATTVQQIIDEAEVSESTFFRYYPTKADLVLSDEFDPIIVEAFRAQPSDSSPVQALRSAFRLAFAQLGPEGEAEQRDRMAIVLAVPELRAAMLDQFTYAMQVLSEVVAERAGRAVDDWKVRTLAGAVIGVAMAVMFEIAEHPSKDFATILDEAMAHLEGGLEL
jgi:AcrR family transcriptional regulator